MNLLFNAVHPGEWDEVTARVTAELRTAVQAAARKASFDL